LKILTVLFLCAWSLLVTAEEGVVIQFTISEQAMDSSESRGYTNAILMKFDEEGTFAFDNRYVLKIRSRRTSESKIELEKYETNYTIELDTSFGVIPEGAVSVAGN